jgi:hypothetical protein
VLAWVALLVAVLAFGTASLLQANGARRPAEHLGGFRLFAQLMSNWQYVAGSVLDLVAVFLIGYALIDLPLFLVQAAASSSLAVTVLGSALLYPGERQRGIWRPVLVVVAGLTVVGSAAASGPSKGLPTVGMVLLGAGLPALLLAGLALGRSSLAPHIRDAVLAGGAYAGLGISLRSLHEKSSVLASVAQTPALLAVCYLAVALFFFGRALRGGTVTEAMAIVVSSDTIAPALVGVLVLGDRTRPGWEVPALLGLAVTIAAVLWLIRLTASAGEPVAVEV